MIIILCVLGGMFGGLLAHLRGVSPVARPLPLRWQMFWGGLFGLGVAIVWTAAQ